VRKLCPGEKRAGTKSGQKDQTVSDKVKTTAKTSEPKQENSAFKKKKPDFYQDLHSPFENIFFLQRAAGNQVVQRLFRSGVIQAKFKMSSPGDTYEQEADRFVEGLPWNNAQKRHFSKTAGTVQRFPAHEQTETIPPSSKGPQAPLPVPTAPPGETKTPSPGLIVEDSESEPAPGQMKKSEFLEQLRAAVCATATEGLKGTIWSAMGCPWIDHWFGYYSRRENQSIERAIRRYAPGTAGAAKARDYIPIICARVRQAIAAWSASGKVTGVPEGIPTGSPETAPVQSTGGSPLRSGNISFKSRDGGKNECLDPPGIQRQLDTGRPLEDETRSKMESAFGQDFSGVRIHTNERAVNLTDRLHARAFTVGRDIAFGSGEYRPGNLIGDALIAHELAHVVQQGEPTSLPMKKGEGEEGVLEEEADVSAVGVVLSLWSGTKRGFKNVSKNAMPRLRSGLRLQRCRASRSCEWNPADYHGVGGWLHCYVYEPLQEDYSGWMEWGGSLASRWGEEVPILGHAAGAVVGFVPWALGGTMKIVVGVPQFLTPKTEEEHFLTVMTMGTYTPAVRIEGGVKYGWWWIRNLFKKNPAIEKEIGERAPNLLSEVAEQAETKAPTVIKEVEGALSRTGRVEVNLGGTGEMPGYINVNNLVGGQKAEGIPNLITASAEDIGSLFKPGSVDHIVANNIVPGTMNWDAVAKGSYTVLKEGGIVEFAEFGGGYASGVNIKAALEAAGFQDVEIIMGVLVRGKK
jgi:hypothetical protein